MTRDALTVATPDGATLAGEIARGAGTPVVLLHAGVADRRAWRDVAGALHALGRTVVAYDRRGFGETAGSASPFRHLDDLVAVLDAVASGGPAHLVGNSQGGRFALDLALERPERVASVTLIAPAVGGAPEPDVAELDADTQEIARLIDEAEEAGDVARLNELEVRLWLDGPSAPAGRVAGAARELALDMNRVALTSGAPEDAGTTDTDAWSRLEQIAVPAAVAHGTLDLPFVVAACRELAARLPDVRAVRAWPDVAHLPALERPDLVAELVAELIG